MAGSINKDWSSSSRKIISSLATFSILLVITISPVQGKKRKPQVSRHHKTKESRDISVKNNETSIQSQVIYQLIVDKDIIIPILLLLSRMRTKNYSFEKFEDSDVAKGNNYCNCKNNVNVKKVFFLFFDTKYKEDNNRSQSSVDNDNINNNNNKVTLKKSSN